MSIERCIEFLILIYANENVCEFVYVSLKIAVLMVGRGLESTNFDRMLTLCRLECYKFTKILLVLIESVHRILRMSFIGVFIFTQYQHMDICTTVNNLQKYYAPRINAQPTAKNFQTKPNP